MILTGIIERTAESLWDSLDEALRRKFVVRDGKRVAKWKTTKAGKYRVEYDSSGKPKEVRITAEERRNRRKGQRKGKIKRKAKEAAIERKRRRSFVARRNAGLRNYDKRNPDVVQDRTKVSRKAKDVDSQDL